MFAWRAGKYDEAAAFGKKRIGISLTEFGENSPEHASALNDQAENFRAQGKYDQAEPLYLQAIKIGKATLGEEHPDYAISFEQSRGAL